MNVAYAPSDTPHAKKLLEALQELQVDAKLLPWKSGEPAPAATVDVLLALGGVTREDMQALPGLQFIQTLSDGYETVDVEAATDLGIYVSYAPAEATGNGDSVAEFAVLLLLAGARRLGAALRAVQDGGAKPQDAVSLLGKTVCIVGMGSIGSGIAQRLAPFAVRVIGVDRNPLNAPRTVPTRPLGELHAALAEADFVVLAIRADEKNRHMFDADTLRAMKPGSVLVNIARGSLADEAALLDAVKSGHLGGAALDVVEHEPLKADNPLLAVPQIFVTPHIAGVTDLMNRGTAEYVQYVLKTIADGHAPKSVLNDPEKPRRALKAAH